MQSWWWDSFSDLGQAVASAVAFYLVLIGLTRLSGLRTYSKMSGFDFPLTIAVGSIVASVVLAPDPPLVRAAVILATLLLLQALVARLRARYSRVRFVVDNEPVVLVRDGRILVENMVKSRVSLPELREKLREANALRLDHVRAVVLETTGDVSVLHDDPGKDPDPWIMEDVRGWEEARTAGTPARRMSGG